MPIEILIKIVGLAENLLEFHQILVSDQNAHRGSIETQKSFDEIILRRQIQNQILRKYLIFQVPKLKCP